MFMNSSKLLLTNTMMIGVIMVISSDNWISMWIGLEISLLSFIPFMQNKKQVSSEAMIKYFIMQSAASSLFLFSIISIMLIGGNMIISLTMAISMLIKLGMVPFHNWVLMIIESLNTMTLLTFLTLLKIPPLIILYQINSNFLTISIMLSMILSPIMCLNQTSIKKTLAYSSIFNMAVIINSVNKMNILMISISIYSLTLFFMVNMMKSMKLKFINQMLTNDFSLWMKLMVWINMLSMSGFPPLMGFLLKILIIQTMMENNQMILMTIMILSSILVTMFYIRMTFSTMMGFFSFKKWMISSNYNKLFLMTLNLSMTPILIYITSII